MNEHVETQLKIIVERVIRPVVTVTNKKRAMREELLAHVTAIYEEELARSGNEAAAIERARHRLGDPRELSGELQRGVPRLVRWSAILAELEFHPDRSLLRMAAVHLAAAAVPYAIAFLLAVPWLIWRGKAAFLGDTARIVLVLALTSASITFGALCGLDRISRALYGPQRSTRRVIAYLLVAAAALPAGAFLVYGTLTGDWTAALGHLRFACWFAAVPPLVCIIASRQMHEETSHQRDWAALDLGG